MCMPEAAKEPVVPRCIGRVGVKIIVAVLVVASMCCDPPEDWSLRCHRAKEAKEKHNRFWGIK